MQPLVYKSWLAMQWTIRGTRHTYPRSLWVFKLQTLMYLQFLVLETSWSSGNWERFAFELFLRRLCNVTFCWSTQLGLAYSETSCITSGCYWQPYVNIRVGNNEQFSKHEHPKAVYLIWNGKQFSTSFECCFSQRDKVDPNGCIADELWYLLYFSAVV